MVAIATYVVISPKGRDELLHELLCSIAERRAADLIIEAVDDSTPHTDPFQFYIRDTSHDGYGHHFFVGFYFDEDLKTHFVNLTIPPWDHESATLKLAPHTDTTEV
jgi:hypothetical protein